MNKKRKLILWLVTLISFLLAVLIIVLNIFVYQGMIMTILLVIVFLVMTFSLQSAISMSFRYKPKAKKYVTRENPFDKDNLENRLIDLKFSRKKLDFGAGFMKVEDDVAYKILIIKDINEYLKPRDEETKNNNSFPGIKKCTKFVGIELFFDYNDVALERIPEFSFQGKNIYYQACYYDEVKHVLVEPNVIDNEIKDEFKPLVENIKNYIGV